MMEEFEDHINYFKREVLLCKDDMKVIWEEKLQYLEKVWEEIMTELDEKLRWGIPWTEQERQMHRVYWVWVTETYGTTTSEVKQSDDAYEEAELAFFLSHDSEKRLAKRFQNKYCTSLSWQRPAIKRKAAKGTAFTDVLIERK